MTNVQELLSKLSPAEVAALTAALKPAPKPKHGPESIVLDLPLDSRERQGALKKIGFMRLPLSASTTLADVTAGAEAYNAANPGKLDAWKAKRDQRMAEARAKRQVAA